ncbi:MAG: sugar ABC transporter permease [Chloroflexi bacterium]|nr:MAG: sugar ABC transporter permease [Chloroflexota bacterium]
MGNAGRRKRHRLALDAQRGLWDSELGALPTRNNPRPLAAIFFLAGLQTISPDLYSAAAVDGAGRVAAFRRITMPLLRPTIVIVLIYETIVAATTFDLVYVMTGGGPADATSLISWYAYAEVFKFLDLGTGAALAFLIALVLLAVIILYLRVLRSEERR